MGHAINKNPAYYEGWTALHEATDNGHLKICEFIINNVKETNPPDNKGITPLSLAEIDNKFEIYKLILKNLDYKGY